MPCGPRDYNHLEDFQRHNNQVLPRMREPLGLQCRVAFLSIFYAWKGRVNAKRDGKRAKLSAAPASSARNAALLAERHVVSHIFGFAAECVRRRVHFTFNG